ncbi:MAG: galactokinase [Acidobacteria bacterium]|nr:MAG: galactokinase [Acidobacteriota bacterium]
MGGKAWRSARDCRGHFERPREAAAVIEQKFEEVFGGKPHFVARAPGRVNLIGEHTDYNDGFVLPVAIDRFVWFAGCRREGRTVRAYALDFHAQSEFSLDQTLRDEEHAWSNYLRGVSKFLESDGHPLPGADLVFGGDVPREAGLSSSAAVEVGAAAFWQGLAGLRLDPVYLAKLARRAENEFVGVPCGIMDQFVSALGRQDHALFLDCRDLSHRHVPLPDEVKIVVCNSGVKRALAQSEYEVRLKQCRQAVAQLGTAGLAVKSLRDVDEEDLEMAASTLTEVLLKRARHVVTENRRVSGAAQALEEGDLERVGELMNQSHESLRDDYEVSSLELDALVEIAQRQPGTLGARMTGAGFGGCTVNLVRESAADSFAEVVRRDYQQAFGRPAEIYLCRASNGAFAE